MRNSRKDETLMAQGLDVLQRNTNTLIELISDLLDTSRIVAGTLTMEFKEVDLKQAVRASVETWRVQAAEKGIAIAKSQRKSRVLFWETRHGCTKS
jgi:signal transduction histidine kinase